MKSIHPIGIMTILNYRSFSFFQSMRLLIYLLMCIAIMLVSLPAYANEKIIIYNQSDFDKLNESIIKFINNGASDIEIIIKGGGCIFLMRIILGLITFQGLSVQLQFVGRMQD